MTRAFLSLPAQEVATHSHAELLGRLTSRLPFAVEPSQRAAWDYQIRHLKELAQALPNAHVFMEFLIPSMGRRADLILLTEGLVFVIEYKVSATHFDRASLNQVYGYGLDLKYFHETSHPLPIVPILVATRAPRDYSWSVSWHGDGLARPLGVNAGWLVTTIQQVCQVYGRAAVDARTWESGRYRPTPTIIEAAQALYRGHAVEEISRSESGAENLTGTSEYVASAIETAKTHQAEDHLLHHWSAGFGQDPGGLESRYGSTESARGRACGVSLWQWSLGGGAARGASTRRRCKGSGSRKNCREGERRPVGRSIHPRHPSL